MRMHVVHADQRFGQGPGEGLGGGYADEETADQAGAVSDGDGVDVIDIAVCGGQRLAQDGEDVFDVGAAGDLGDYASVLGVEFDLAGDDVGAHDAAVFDDGCAGFVAGGFDAEDAHYLFSGAGVAVGRVVADLVVGSVG